MSTLKSITAYHGWFILEYSRVLEGQPASRFVIENLPGGPLPAGNSLNEAKRVIDGLGGRLALWPPVPKEPGARPRCDETQSTPPKRHVSLNSSLTRTESCPPCTRAMVHRDDDPILSALRDRISQDRGSLRRVARFLSVHSGVILEWLAGTRKPRQATLDRIAACLKGPAIRA
jgi:hypothetical protein